MRHNGKGMVGDIINQFIVTPDGNQHVRNSQPETDACKRSDNGYKIVVI